MTPFGDAQVDTNEAGQLVVTRADPVIGISVELLAVTLGTTALPVDELGRIWLAGDPAYKYVPEGFWSATPAGQHPVADSGFVVCRRVAAGTWDGWVTPVPARDGGLFAQRDRIREAMGQQVEP